MKLRYILMIVSAFAGILSVGCSGADATDTGDAGKPTAVPASGGTGKVPTGGKKGGIEPPGI